MKKAIQISLFGLPAGMKLLLGILLLLGGLNTRTIAQDARAERMIVRGNMAKGMARYKKIIKKSEINNPACVRLSQLYAAKGSFRDAALYLGQAIALGDSGPERIFTFGKYLLQSGNFSDAQKWLDKYDQKTGDPSMTAPLRPKIEAGLELLSRPPGFSVSTVNELNSKYSEIGATQLTSGVVVTSNRRRGFFIRYNPGKNVQFYDLYLANQRPDRTLEKPRLMEGRVNFRYHDGPAVFTEGESRIWLTRSNISKGKKKAANGDTKLRIQYQDRKNQFRWGKRIDLPFASADYTIAHPALTPKGDTLIFASDMPGGMGGFDLYYSRLVEGVWQTPKNLGPAINTASNEAFPSFIGYDRLYFASDRPGGLGGLDIYFTFKFLETWQEPTNAGAPLNSPYDEFSLQFNPKRPEGYFASNRPGGIGSDDIYRFKKFQGIQGIIVDAVTYQPIENATVEIMDLREKFETYQTHEGGGFSHYLPAGQDVFIKVRAEGYQEVRQAYSLHALKPGEDFQFMITLQPEFRRELTVSVLDEAGKPLPDAAVELYGDDRVAQQSTVNGGAFFTLGEDLYYTLLVSKPGYIPAIYQYAARPIGENMIWQQEVRLKKGESTFISGIVTDKSSGAPIDKCIIRVADGNTQEILEGTLPTDWHGRFWGILPKAKQLEISARRIGYFSQIQIITLDSVSGNATHLSFQLDSVKAGQVVHTLYYGYAESNLTAKGRRDLDEVAQFLKSNPSLKVALISHTDSRGNAKFNQDLSEKRAAEAVTYLYEKGIPLDRMLSKGMGEQQPVNGCTDGKQCTEEEHSLNRRTEVVVE